ncbi:signal peptidase I [bacterium]|nr:signal peptidase I [bacterium]
MNKPIDRYELFNGAEWSFYANGKSLPLHFPNPSPQSDQILVTIRTSVGTLRHDDQFGKELKMPLPYNGVDFDISSIHPGRTTIVIAAGDNVMASASVFFKPTEVTNMKSGLFRLGRILLLLFLVKSFLLSAGAVPVEQENFSESSMAPTVNLGDRFFYSKMSYIFKPPAKGDVVAFFKDIDYEKLAKIEGAGKGKTTKVLFVKRVIATSGDEVQVLGNQVYLNGNLLEEGYATLGESSMNVGPLVVPDGYLFVMGDNRPYSEDSRHWISQSSGNFILEGFSADADFSESGGFIPINDVAGKPFLVFWPLSEFRPIS